MGFFTNDRFLLLENLYEHQIEVSGVTFVPVTQLELANLMKCSKVKVNKLLGELMENGYVEVYNNTKGRYKITEEGLSAIKKYT